MIIIIIFNKKKKNYDYFSVPSQITMIKKIQYDTKIKKMKGKKHEISQKTEKWKEKERRK